MTLKASQSQLFNGTKLSAFVLTLSVLLGACQSEHGRLSSSTEPGSAFSSPKATPGHFSGGDNPGPRLKVETISRLILPVTLHLSGQIHAEVGKEIDVSPRFSGRIIKINVLPGQEVSKEQILALIDSHDVGSLEAQLLEAHSDLEIARAHQERERQIYEEQLARPQALIEAKTRCEQEKVQLSLAESEFQRIEGLYKERISSGKDFIAAQANLKKSQLAHKEALSSLQREERLYGNKSLLKKDLQLAAAETARAQRHVDTLEQRLIFLGMQAQSVHALYTAGKVSGVVPLTARAAGLVTHQGVDVGEIVEAGKKAFTITDMSVVAVTANVPEWDIGRVKLGNKVFISVSGYPDKKFQGAISYIANHVNQETRTVAIRAHLSNNRRLFKLNMHAEIELESQKNELLSCPKAAVQERDGHTVVYVAADDGYHERQIKCSNVTDDYCQVLSGLKEGEKVVTQGSLMLKDQRSYKP